MDVAERDNFVTLKLCEENHKRDDNRRLRNRQILDYFKSTVDTMISTRSQTRKHGPDKGKVKPVIPVVQEDNYQDENMEPDVKNSFKGMSDYEKMVEKNRQDRMIFLQTLGINKAKEDLYELKPKKKIVIVKRLQKEPAHVVRRKSRRLAGIKAEMALQQSMGDFPSMKPEPEEKETLPKTLSFNQSLMYEDKSMNKHFSKEMQLLKGGMDDIPIPPNKYREYFKAMQISSKSIAKVCSVRITSMALHPSASKMLVSAGDKYGHLGFWNVESTQDDGLYLHKPHLGNLSCQMYNPGNASQLFTSSYDCTVRCGDLEKMEFSEVYCSKDEVSCMSLDFVSPSTFLVAHRDGTVVIVDHRTPNKRAKSHQCSSGSLKSVNVHPNKNYFIVAGNNRIASIWDLRELRKESVADMEHTKCVNSAYFSPVTGNRILTTCMDNTLNIYDSTDYADIKLKKKISHDNWTGRWLTCFRASWFRDGESFVVGSMLHPRRVEMYSADGGLVHKFEDENLNSITSINVFHSFRPVLACGNSSGKVYIFKTGE